ncbi:lytic transglycosylase domain-containing protein [Sphingomonas crusticola]|uniref:lytic transglycosylase domain-containing protein n=1 Tax=Sphingomonas crusticola TaxID=1697973 RepID=UPI000E234BE6|nr:lytic transglycosylase domain-containing protein [Sphingomonas crusticola]
MAALRHVVVVVIFAAGAVAARAEGPPRWRAFIQEAAARTRIPADWIGRVMRVESAGRTLVGGRPITSRAGAMGLMQLMPATWVEMRARMRLGRDPYDPRDNILAGAGFLRMMYDRFGYPGLFGAYNAGPDRYRAHLLGAPLPAETSAYIAQIVESGAAGRPANRPLGTRIEPSPRRTLFVALDGHTPADGPVERIQPALFAIRHDVAAERVPAVPGQGGE